MALPVVRKGSHIIPRSTSPLETSISAHRSLVKAMPGIAKQSDMAVSVSMEVVWRRDEPDRERESLSLPLTARRQGREDREPVGGRERGEKKSSVPFDR